MKKLLFLLLLVMPISILSQIPQTITWQGILQDASGNNLDGNYSITVKLFDVATGGTAIWTENHNSVTISNGITNLVLGSVTSFNLNFDKQYWLEITVGSGSPLTRIKLTSVPYSLYSAKSNSVIQNDSLVLKDAQGVTRMVLNPNTGTFKMMNKDTVWYELSVQSPPKETSYNNDGYKYVSSGKDVKVYDKNGKLKYEQTETSDDNNNSRTSLFNEYNQDEKLYYSNTAITSEDYDLTNGSIYETNNTEKFFDANGNIYCEKTTHHHLSSKVDDLTNQVVSRDEKTETFKYFNLEGAEVSKTVNYWNKGKLVKTENYSNGVITRKVEDLMGGLTTLIYTQGNLTNTITSSNESQGITVSSGVNSFSVNQTSTGVQFRKPGQLALAVSPNSSNDGYSFGLNSSYSKNPSLTFSNSGSGGSLTYSGKDFNVNSDLTSNATVTANFVKVNGDLSVTGPKKFKIDHPTDNTKYLQHAAIESNEVLNVYSGNNTTNGIGLATVTLPDYFNEINTDVRYVLTIIGTTFARAIIYQEIDSNNQFVIKTDEPNIKVSWQITAKRNDAYLQSNPFYDIINK